MNRKKTGFLITIIFLVFFAFTGRVLAEGNFIIKYIVPDRAGKLLFLGGKKQDKKIKTKYNVTRLSEPPRMVVDIENAVLPEGKKSIELSNSGLKGEIRIAQFSTDPDVVRVVFTSDSAEALDEIKIRIYKNNVAFELEEVELAKIPVASVYKDRNIPESNDKKETGKLAEKEVSGPQEKPPVIKKVEKQEVRDESEKVVKIEKENVDGGKPPIPATELKEKEAILDEIKKKVKHNIVINNVVQHENRVLISGAGIISLAEPFVLDSPTRKIFDIPEAVLNSAGLIRVFTLNNNDTVKVAQFDPKTVRIVVETGSPDDYTNAFSPDLQSIIISTKNDISFAEFPDNNSAGAVKDIKVIKQDENITKVLLTSEKPIIHNIDRLYSPDRLDISLFNIKQPEKEKLIGLEKTGQFHGFKTEVIEKFPNGSKWKFPLNSSTVIKSKLSLDGRVLEITLQDTLAVVPGDAGAVKNKIIIDPGHGGYDPGAQNNGIYEKDLALDVSRRVKKYLEGAGFYVMMTREQDKTVSLKERVALTNKENPDLFLSIHVNASRNPDIRGVETHWYTIKSRPLAMHVQDQMVNRVVIPDRGLKNSRFYVLRHTKVPAILAEIGYMSNEIEMAQLMTEERKEASARAIAEGIINYIKEKSRNSDPSGKQKL